MRSVCCKIEISREVGLVNYYFQVPFKCSYLSSLTKEKFLLNVDRTSNESKLTGIFDNIENFEVEMDHNMRKFRGTHFIYTIFGTGDTFYLQFILISISFIINCLLLINLNDSTIVNYRYQVIFYKFHEKQKENSFYITFCLKI